MNENDDYCQLTPVSDTEPLSLPIEPLIYQVRGYQVMLDSDLARLYGVDTRRLNEQVKRNLERFPEDFMFQRRSAKLDVAICDIKLGRDAQTALCIHRKRGGDAQ